MSILADIVNAVKEVVDVARTTAQGMSVTLEPRPDPQKRLSAIRRSRSTIYRSFPWRALPRRRRGWQGEVRLLLSVCGGLSGRRDLH
jgi:hypothetical protein